MSQPVVDPRFGVTLREIRVERGLSLRALARAAVFGKSFLHELESGVKQPSEATAARLDEVLHAGGRLSGLVQPAPSLPGVDVDRVGHVLSGAGRVDATTVEALEAVLAQHRRLEDAAGSAAMMAPTQATAVLVRNLFTNATGSGVWSRLAGVASQWACYTGWLCATTGRHGAGHAWYRRSRQWAVQAGDADLEASALQMLGHLAWVQGRHLDMIELSRAAAAAAASTAVASVAVQQEARGLALVGDADGCDRRLGQAAELAWTAAGETAAWLYFYDPAFLALQRGLAQQYLHRDEAAVELISTGLGGLTTEVRRSDWVGWYVVRLAESLAAAGDLDAASAHLQEAHATAGRTGAVRLLGDVDDMVRRLGL